MSDFQDPHAALEGKVALLSKRMHLVEEFIEAKFRESFRDFTVRHTWHGGEGYGGGGFNNPRSNGRRDSFEDYEEEDTFGQRRNGGRRGCVTRRSSSSNVSHTNVPSQKRTYRGGGSTLRKRTKFSAITNSPYQLTRPSIEYQTISTQAVGIEQQAATTSSGHHMFQIQVINNETVEQRTQNENSFNELIMETATSSQNLTNTSSDERIETEISNFGTHEDENNVELFNAIGIDDNAAPVVVSNANNNNTTPSTATEEEITTQREFRSFKTEATEAEQTCKNIANMDNNISLFTKDGYVTPSQVNVTPSTSSQCQPGTTGSRHLFIDDLPLTSTNQLPNLLDLSEPEANHQGTELSTTDPAVVTQSSENNTTPPPPTDLDIDMPSIVNNSIPVASLNEFTANVVPLEFDASSNVDDSVSLLSALLNGHVASVDDTIDVTTPLSSDVATTTSATNNGPVQLPRISGFDDDGKLIETASTNVSSVESPQQADDSLDSSSASSVSFGESSSDSDLQILLDSRDPLSFNTNGKHNGQSASSSSGSEATVITLSSDSEDDDNVVKPSPKRKPVLNSTRIVSHDPNRQRNSQGSNSVLKRLAEEYPSMSDAKRAAKRKNAPTSREHANKKQSLSTCSPPKCKPSLRFLTKRLEVQSERRSVGIRAETLSFAFAPNPKGQAQRHSSGSISDFNVYRKAKEQFKMTRTTVDREDMMDSVSDSSSVEDVIAGVKSNLSKGVAILGNERLPSYASVGGNNNCDNVVQTLEVHDKDATINVETNHNDANEKNQDVGTSTSGGIDDQNVDDDSCVYSCHQLQHETGVIITRKPTSSKPTSCFSKTVTRVESNHSPMNPLLINMSSVDEPRNDVAATSPDGLPPPLIPIDSRSEINDKEIEILGEDSFKDQADEEPTMPILSVSESQLSVEKINQQNKTRTDNEFTSIRSRQLDSNPEDVCTNSAASNGESHNSERVSQTKSSSFNQNPIIRDDSVMPFSDFGSDRMCKRRKCHLCEKSFYTHRDLDQHVEEEHQNLDLEDEQQNLNFDSEDDSQTTEVDSSYNGRIKQQQRKSVRNESSSLVQSRGLDQIQDAESEAELPRTSKNSSRKRPSVPIRQLLCPYCKKHIPRNRRRKHIMNDQLSNNQQDFCSITKEQLKRELANRARISWEDVPGCPGLQTWKLPDKGDDCGPNQTESTDPTTFTQVSNYMTVVAQEDETASLDTTKFAVNPSHADDAVVSVPRAGPSTNLSERTILERQMCNISSAIVGKESYDVDERFSAGQGSEIQASSSITLGTASSLNSIESDDTCNRGSPSNVANVSLDHTFIISPLSDVDEDFVDLQLQPSVSTNMQHNDSMMTEEVLDSDVESTTTDDFPADEDSSRDGVATTTTTRKSQKIVKCPGCFKSMRIKSLKRHRRNICPAKPKQQKSKTTDLVCKYEDCGYIPANIAEYREHLFTHPLGVGSACKKCGKVFVEKLNLQDHIRTHQINVPHDATGVSITGSLRLQPKVYIKKLRTL